MITIEYSEQKAKIKFDYDIKVINIIRGQIPRHWNAVEKCWEIPSDKAPKLIKQLENEDIKIIGEPKTEEITLINTPSNFKLKTKPFKHQIEGINYGMQYKKYLLGDEQGLGKTKQIIDIAVAKKLKYGYKHCLIICCIDSLKWNWKEEISIHSNESCHIIGGRYTLLGKGKNGSSTDKLEDLENLSNDYFQIINIESLRQKYICNKIRQLCQDKDIEMIAVDEVHKCKNPATLQGRALLKLKTDTQIAMSGTPLINTPLDLYIILKWLGYEDHNFGEFKNHYCILDRLNSILGYRNLSELQLILDDIMLRRLKKDVLDLPEKLRSIEYVEMNKAQARIYNDVLEQIKLDIDKIKLSPNPLAMLIRLRQATGYTGILSTAIQESAKLDRLEDLVDERVQNNEKVIIFSNWTDMTHIAEERLKRFSPAVVTGEIKNADIAIHKFMTDPSCKIIIGTTAALGTGWTLTAATTVIFLDSPWNRANKEQAEDRAHRIGTTSTVNIITLVCKNTIDERIEELIYKKGEMADALLDKNISTRPLEMIDYLLK